MLRTRHSSTALYRATYLSYCLTCAVMRTNNVSDSIGSAAINRIACLKRTVNARKKYYRRPNAHETTTTTWTCSSRRLHDLAETRGLFFPYLMILLGRS